MTCVLNAVKDTGQLDIGVFFAFLGERSNLVPRAHVPFGERESQSHAREEERVTRISQRSPSARLRSLEKR